MASYSNRKKKKDQIDEGKIRSTYFSMRREKKKEKKERKKPLKHRYTYTMYKCPTTRKSLKNKSNGTKEHHHQRWEESTYVF
jgi:hypothetical protein